MTQIEFGSIEYRIMVSLQRELVRAYVHFARRNEFGSRTNIDERVSDHSSALRVIEDEGLISALGRLRRFNKVAKARGLLDANAGAGLKALDTRIVEVRDMREHYDDYILGKGRRPDEFLRKHKFEDGVEMQSDPMWSIQRGAEEVIGCRLSVNDLAHALNAYRCDVEAAGWLLPHTATQIARAASSLITKN